jgi:hypothetical protein
MSPLRRFLLPLLVLVALAFASPASAAGTVAWAIHDVAEPSSFNASDAPLCAGVEHKCDRYQLVIQNTGDRRSHGPITVTDRLPAGITASTVPSFQQSGQFGSPTRPRWQCLRTEGGAVLTCKAPESEGEVESIAAGHYAPFIDVIVSAPTAGMSGVLRNDVTVQGGGASVATSAVQQSTIGNPLAFEVAEFAFEPLLAGGASAREAGARPWELVTSLGISVGFTPPHGRIQPELIFTPARNMRSISVELPAGIVGDPAATEHCEEAKLHSGQCPATSEVGKVAIAQAKSTGGEFLSSEDTTKDVTDVYNMVPDAGYPVEFGFAFNNAVPVILYGNVVHTGSGYRLRITSPGIPSLPEAIDATLTFFGEPGALNGSGRETAFLTNPADCTAESEGLSDGVKGTVKDFSSGLELESWGGEGAEHIVTGEDTVYPQLTGCGALHFNPSLSLAPSPAGSDPATEEGSTQADAPSAYSVDLKSPQSTKYSELATPPVRTATVTLPAGVSVSPSAANGLGTCQANGPEGINVGSSEIGQHGQDLGDPEATELGEGHEGGNDSPYDDGFYHTAPGHCPSSSSLGTVEVTTPLLEAPLHGHIYLAAPKCGGAGQPECTEASATNGELFAGYIEVAGSGVIIKIPGTIAANPTTGQLTGTFTEAPQFPFSELKVHFHGGPRAPVANPQTCGSFTTTSNLEPWSHDRANPTEGTPDALTSNTFEINGCAATMPFAPSFSAGTTASAAGQYSPFVLSFSRQDGEQDLSGLSETMPAGLLGKLSGIPQCPEAQANAGTCSAESLLGSVTATAGPGSEPFTITGGRVYLTGPYGGGPFGLSVVVPAKAGPFNLGNVVVRASIHINPETSAVTVTTDPLPQIKDGVPFRLRTVTTEINRSSFILNATNCTPSAVTGSLSGDLPNGVPGSTAPVSAPYQATGCQNLKFHPEFSVSTQGNGTTKGNGASLDVKINYPEPYNAYANVAKVDTSLPYALSSRLTTLNKACTEQQFALNPANCPPASAVGLATAHSPLLNATLTGPAYLVSHGGRAFPDLDIILQGEGVVIDLKGNTDIKNGITYSKFETVPDAPVSSFELNLPEKENSLLGAIENLCAPTKSITVSKKETKRVHGRVKHVTVKVKKTVAEALIMPTELTGQNGAKITQSTKISVTGCKKTTVKKPVKKHAKTKKANGKKK